MTDRLDELLAAAAVEHLGEDAGLGSITAWVVLHKAAPDLLYNIGILIDWIDGQIRIGTLPKGLDFPAARAAIDKAIA